MMTDLWKPIDAIMTQGLDDVFPAAVLWIEYGGRVRFSRAYGWLHPETRTLPVSTDTWFDLASLTKLFTATALMTLAAQGRVALNEPIVNVIPEWRGMHPLQPAIDPVTKQIQPLSPNAAGRQVDAGEVTFWHLLTHTSGLAAWVDACQGYLSEEISPEVGRTRLEAVLAAPRFVYPPGQGLVYSDVGFMVLGAAIQRLAGMPLADYLARAVLAPLGMTQIAYRPLDRGIPREQIAPTEFCAWRGRRIWGEVHDENAACLGGVAGHAGLFATAREVARLGACFLRGGDPILPGALASAMVLEQAWVGNERRGLGWKLQTPDSSPIGAAFGPRSFGHTGFTGTSLWVDPDRDVIVVLLTNRVYYGRDNSGIARVRIRLHEAVADLIDNVSERNT